MLEAENKIVIMENMSLELNNNKYDGMVSPPKNQTANGLHPFTSVPSSILRNCIPRKNIFAMEGRADPNKIEKYIRVLEDSVEVAWNSKKMLMKDFFELKSKSNEDINKIHSYEKLVTIQRDEIRDLNHQLLIQNDQLIAERKKVVDLQIEVLRKNICTDSQTKETVAVLRCKNANLLKKLKLLETENEELKKEIKQHESNFVTSTILSTSSPSSSMVTIKRSDIIKANHVLSNYGMEYAIIQEVTPEKNKSAVEFELITHVKEEPLDIDEVNDQVDPIDSNTVQKPIVQNHVDKPRVALTNQSEEIFVKMPNSTYHPILGDTVKYNILLSGIEPMEEVLISGKSFKDELMKPISQNIYNSASKSTLAGLRKLIKNYSDIIRSDLDLKRSIDPKLVEAPLLKRNLYYQTKIIQAVDELCPSLDVLKDLPKPLAESLAKDIFQNKSPSDKLIATTKTIIENVWEKVVERVERRRMESGNKINNSNNKSPNIEKVSKSKKDDKSENRQRSQSPTKKKKTNNANKRIRDRSSENQDSIKKKKKNESAGMKK